MSHISPFARVPADGATAPARRLTVRASTPHGAPTAPARAPHGAATAPVDAPPALAVAPDVAARALMRAARRLWAASAAAGRPGSSPYGRAAMQLEAAALACLDGDAPAVVAARIASAWRIAQSA